MAEIAAAAERMRQSLIDADALAVDHRSREAETKLHLAGRAFFTQRFRTTVDELVARVRQGRRGDPRHRRRPRRAQQGHALRTTSPADAAERAARDVERGRPAPRATCLALIARSGHEVAAAKDATDRTVDELARTDRTVRSLAAAAERIGMVVKLIEGDRRADLAAGAQRHDRGGPRRRRRPRLRGGRRRGEVAGAADRQGDRRDRRTNPRHPARGRARP